MARSLILIVLMFTFFATCSEAQKKYEYVQMEKKKLEMAKQYLKSGYNYLRKKNYRSASYCIGEGIGLLLDMKSQTSLQLAEKYLNDYGNLLGDEKYSADFLFDGDEAVAGVSEDEDDLSQDFEPPLGGDYEEPGISFDDEEYKPPPLDEDDYYLKIPSRRNKSSSYITRSDTGMDSALNEIADVRDMQYQLWEELKSIQQKLDILLKRSVDNLNAGSGYRGGTGPIIDPGDTIKPILPPPPKDLVKYGSYIFMGLVGNGTYHTDQKPSLALGATAAHRLSDYLEISGNFRYLFSAGIPVATARLGYRINHNKNMESLPKLVLGLAVKSGTRVVYGINWDTRYYFTKNFGLYAEAEGLNLSTKDFLGISGIVLGVVLKY